MQARATMTRRSIPPAELEAAKTYFADQGLEVLKPTDYLLEEVEYSLAYGRGNAVRPEFKVSDGRGPPSAVIALYGNPSWIEQKLMVWTILADRGNFPFYTICQEGYITLFLKCMDCVGFHSEFVHYLAFLSCSHDRHRVVKPPPMKPVYSDDAELFDLLYGVLEEQLDSQGRPVTWARTTTQVDGGRAIFDDDFSHYLFNIRGVAHRLGCTSTEIRQALLKQDPKAKPVRLRRTGVIRRYWILPVRSKPTKEEEVREEVGLDV